MKKLLLVAVGGFAFGYFGAYLVSHAWRKYYQEEEEENNDDGYDTVSNIEKFHSHWRIFSWTAGLSCTVILIWKALLKSQHRNEGGDSYVVFFSFWSQIKSRVEIVYFLIRKYASAKI